MSDNCSHEIEINILVKALKAMIRLETTQGITDEEELDILQQAEEALSLVEIGRGK